MKFTSQFLRLNAIANDIDKTKFRVRVHPKNICSYGDADVQLTKLDVASFIDVAGAGRLMVVETLEEIEAMFEGLPED